MMKQKTAITTAGKRRVWPTFQSASCPGPNAPLATPHKPEKLPGPQVERTHLVYRNSSRNVSHHEGVFGARKPNWASTQKAKDVHKIGFHPMFRASGMAIDVNIRKMMYMGRISSKGGR